jgi:hypothetical protein
MSRQHRGADRGRGDVDGPEVLGLAVVDEEWGSLPGGELEARRPKIVCPTCRERQRQAVRAQRGLEAGTPGPEPRLHPQGPICFECYRVDLARERAMRAARNLHTASEERFRCSLPFEPVNRVRLEQLRAQRAAERASKRGSHRFADRRRQAQINARHTLDRLADGLLSHRVAEPVRYPLSPVEGQLPDAWLPFVVSR